MSASRRNQRFDATLPNEPAFAGALKCDEHWATVHELLKGAEGFISIDSCLQHFSASAKKAGVVIWGSTRWTQFGYTHNANLQFHMNGKWDEAKYDMNDPRNIMVDPAKVVAAYKDKLNTGKNAVSNIRCSAA